MKYFLIGLLLVALYFFIIRKKALVMNKINILKMNWDTGTVDFEVNGKKFTYKKGTGTMSGAVGDLTVNAGTQNVSDGVYIAIVLSNIQQADTDAKFINLTTQKIK